MWLYFVTDVCLDQITCAYGTVSVSDIDIASENLLSCIWWQKVSCHS